MGISNSDSEDFDGDFDDNVVWDRPRKKTLRKIWRDFCDFCSDVLSRLTLSFKKNGHSHRVSVRDVGLLHDSDDADCFDPIDSEDAFSSSHEKMTKSLPETRDTDITANAQPSFSAETFAAAQNTEESVKPVTLFKAGIFCWALAGMTTMVALGTGIYPLLALAGLLAVLGTALMITAYVLNDEKKDGTLVDQTFPKEASAISSLCFGCY